MSIASVVSITRTPNAATPEYEFESLG